VEPTGIEPSVAPFPRPPWETIPWQKWYPRLQTPEHWSAWYLFSCATPARAEWSALENTRYWMAHRSSSHWPGRTAEKSGKRLWGLVWNCTACDTGGTGWESEKRWLKCSGDSGIILASRKGKASEQQESDDCHI